MQAKRTLDQLPVGHCATVTALSACCSPRLTELGFVPGRKITALHAAPWGDPVAYSICGAVIALRRADARFIFIREAAPP